MRNLLILWLQIFIFCILIGMYTALMPTFFDMSYFVNTLIIVIISVSIFTFRKKSNIIKGNYFTSTFLFLLSFLIVHFQFYLDFALGLRSDLGVRYYLDYTLLPKAITISALAVNIFIIGSTFASLVSKKTYINSNKVLIYPSLTFLKLLLLILLVLYILGTPKEYFFGGYGELMNEAGLSYIHYKSSHLIHLTILAYIISVINIIRVNDIQLSIVKYLKFLGVIPLILIGSYLFLNLLSGSREPLIAVSLALASGYFISQRKKLKLKTLTITLVVIGMTFQVLTFFRATNGDLNISDRIEIAFEERELNAEYYEASVMPATYELGGSVRAYHAMIMRQEDNEPLYGKSSIGYLLNIIPGLGLLSTKLIGLEFLSSSQLITNWMGADHGMGTTALADVYLDFGLYGALLIFLLFGYILSKLDFIAYNRFIESSFFVQVLVLVMISNSIFISRSSIISAFADVTTTYIILLVAILIGRLHTHKPKNKLKLMYKINNKTI